MPTSERGFSLFETVVALAVLMAGVLSAAAVLSAGMQSLSSSPSDVIVTQKAAEAIEAVFSARDSDKLTWAQIRNVRGASTSDGGIFLDGPQPLLTPGTDGLVNTSDDGGTNRDYETQVSPGKDGHLGTADDETKELKQFQREIQIRDVSGTNGQLRTITVTLSYYNGPTKRTFTLSTLISSYS